MSYFQKQGRALLGNGYLIVPIKPGHKRPALSNWQHARLGTSDLSAHPGHGVGILTGQGAHPIAAIDIDTLDEELAKRFVDWCQEHLGDTCERIGRAPKILLPYRAAREGWGKATSAWFEDATGERHRVEVLGKGQQFVAYHTHPDTGQPYEWVDLLGGLEHVRADLLPVITEDQVAEALRTFETMAEAAGMHRAQGASAVYSPAGDEADPLMAFEPPVGVSMAELQKCLSYIDPNDYDTWLRVGMALHHEYEGGEDALDLWDQWSQGGAAYAGREDLAYRWGTFGKGARTTTVRWILKHGRANERVAVRQEKHAALETLLAEIEACDDSLVLMEDVATAARAVVAEVPGLQAQVAAALRGRFKALTGVTLPAADLGRALREPKAPTVVARRPLTEFGNAERMLDKYGQGLMHVPELNAWYCWTGVYWRRAHDVEIEHYAKETVRALVQEVNDHQDAAEFFKWCSISQQAKMVKNMVTLAKSDPRVAVPADEIDKHARYMGAANGVIDLKTGELLPPDPELRITRVVGCDYDPDAPAPLWEQTVLEVFNGDTEMASFFQRLVGYAAMGNPKEDAMVIPWGNGSNGKSTLLGAVRKAFGGYARAADAASFVSDGRGGGNAGGAREDLLRLKGARFVYVNEPDEGGELREGSVKAMTGGDAITARGLYSTATVEILPTWVAFMPTNHKPIVKGSDDGIWRRLMLLPFTRKFDQEPGSQKDPDRETKLLAELEGVLAWIVRGALAYQKAGLAPVGAVQEARDAYRRDMDLLAEWLEECCEVGPMLQEESSRLWDSWCEYAKNRGLLVYVKNSVSLGRRLDSRFPATKDRVGKRMRKGLRVRSEFDPLP